MVPWINYHHLNYFRVIATEGSIAKAAEKLRLGQPTLSAQLKLFEETLGTHLFERHHKRLVLTESGRMTLNYANEIFRLGDELLEVLKDNLSKKKPHIQIGALDSVPKSIVMALAKSAYKIQPCTISIVEGKADELMTELSLHKVDLFISNFVPAAHDMNRIFSRKISELPVSIWGAPAYKGLKKNFPQSLASAPFILPTSHSKLRLDVERFLKNAEIFSERVAETQDTSLQKIMAQDGVGLMFASHLAVKDLTATKQLIEIGQAPGVVEEIYLISAGRKIENPISSRLMKEFKLS